MIARERSERVKRELLRLYEADVDPTYPREELADLDALVVLAQDGAALKAALRQIVDMPINESASAAWHFAEVRAIARAALFEVEPAA